jgi:plastocyanin
LVDEIETRHRTSARRTNPHTARLRPEHVTTTATRLPTNVLALAGSAVLAVALAACSAEPSHTGASETTPMSSFVMSSATSSSAAAPDTVISISLLAFMPPSISVKAGSTVTWRNDEPITHTVTSGTFTGVERTTGLRSGQSPDGLFNARLEGTGDTFSYTFTTPGTYPYYCDIHFGMNATVIVTP